MKYSYNWLQSHIEDPLPSAHVLKDVIIFHAFEVEEVAVMATDTVFDIKVLPDRAGDCLSHYGMAREIAGLLDLNLKTTAYQLPAIDIPIALDVRTVDCLRYCAIQIDGIKVGPSPAWLVKKLEAIGQRSINNIVDATNYILFDTGQPTHAFDADKVAGPISVYTVGSAEEQITTLSGEQKTIKEGMMVIADSKQPLAIAGVKGGNAAEVTNDTTSIILEIASFDAVSVRKTSRALGLMTDAAKRFENNPGSFLVEQVAAQLVTLIQTLAGGTVSAIGDYYPDPQIERTLSFTLADIQRLLGPTISDNAIVKVLDRYGYSYDSSTFYTVAIPAWRQDIIGAHDMAEEIGRVIGYDTIPTTALPFIPTVVVNEDYEKIRAIKMYLITQGYREVMTYTFRKKGDLAIAYGAKDKSALRANLSDAIKESYELNRLNAPLLGVSEIQIFEIGTVFTKDAAGAPKEEIHIALADKNGITEKSIEDFYHEHSAAIETIDVTAIVAQVLTKRHKKTFVPWSVYPFITRDIAVWVSGQENSSALKHMVDTFAAQYCVRPAVMFDTFTKTDPTLPSGQAISMAYRLVFQSTEKTLTIAETEKEFQLLITEIAAHPGMTIR
jgi:phenylalanyl-tRNA synthetase beta chain